SKRARGTMIKDAAKIVEIQKEWATIVSLVNWSRGWMSEAAYINETPPDEFYNLPLVLAYSTLDSVLDQFIDEGVFQCKYRQLGRMMESAKTGIKWRNYDLVSEGREARNDLAHENAIVDKAHCLKYVDAIGNELRGWGLIS